VIVRYALSALQTSLDDFVKTQNAALTITDTQGAVVLSSPRGTAARPGADDLAASAQLDSLHWRATTWVAGALVYGSIADLHEAVLVVTAALLVLVLIGLRALHRALTASARPRWACSISPSTTP
jgi:hypothetical protein